MKRVAFSIVCAFVVWSGASAEQPHQPIAPQPLTSDNVPTEWTLQALIDTAMAKSALLSDYASQIEGQTVEQEYNRQNERCTFCKTKGARKIQIHRNRSGHQIGVRFCCSDVLLCEFFLSSNAVQIPIEHHLKHIKKVHFLPCVLYSKICISHKFSVPL